MRALEFCVFIICFNLAIPLVAGTGIFGAGPGGTSLLVDWALWLSVIAMLTAGGISIMGWSFKVPTVITVFATIYGVSVAGMDILLCQIIQPLEVAAVFAGTFTALATVMGIRGVMQLAGGGFEGME